MSVTREKHYAEFTALMRRRVVATIGSAGRILQAELKAKLSFPGKGRLYARSAKARSFSRMAHGELTQKQVIAMLLKERKRLTARREAGKSARYRGLRNSIGVHRASAPGAPPAIDTGLLRKTMQLDPSRLNDPNPRVRVGTNLQYAKGLEYGTRHVAPRPYFRPTVRKVRPMIRKLFTAKGLLEGGIQ